MCEISNRGKISRTSKIEENSEKVQNRGKFLFWTTDKNAKLRAWIATLYMVLTSLSFYFLSFNSILRHSRPVPNGQINFNWIISSTAFCFLSVHVGYVIELVVFFYFLIRATSDTISNSNPPSSSCISWAVVLKFDLLRRVACSRNVRRRCCRRFNWPLTSHDCRANREERSLH